ncbi:MAG: DUF692 domain-containing protein [Proteobacteria bacterium]|nr:MAG: DUF692 domain-containing protein [Pseudomonadota bacterium]
MPDQRGLPSRSGVGLKSDHYAMVIGEQPDIGWFEVHAENYMGAGGPAHHYLEVIRRDYPLSIHGVGLSIGSSSPLDLAHLRRLKAVVDRYEPGSFSEHLAWSSHGGAFYNDLLPLPYTRETLIRVSDHIDQVQAALGRRMLLENPATYVAFECATMIETGFLEEVTARTGCGLLLDINNVFVSATNHGFETFEYIDAFPLREVEEIHLAGHAVDRDDDGSVLLIDTHDRTVAPSVWSLYEATIDRIGPVPTLIEWDTDVPAWSVLADEARKADAVLNGAGHGVHRAVAG